MEYRNGTRHPVLIGFLLLAVLLGSLSVCSMSVAASSAQTATKISPSATPAPATTVDPPEVVYPDALVVSHSAKSAIVIDASRGRRLYMKDESLRLPLPAANKIMTALIAAEKLALDAKVTISKVAAEAGSGESTDDRITLKTGDKYFVEYLLYRLLFYDSDAAAIALAEQISNEEAEFVKLMNARASTYGLLGTVFANASGQPVLKNGSGSGDSLTKNQVIENAQYTTVSDLATLVQAALLNEKFSRLFKKQSEYIVLDGKTLVPMVNRISRLWPFSEGRVSGAFYSELTQATCITTGTVNGFNIVTVTAQGTGNQVVNDVLAIYDACQRTYVNTLLVQVGNAYTGAQETTMDGEVFGLVYQKTVNYIHPIGDPYLKSPVHYNSLGPYSRPIQSTMTVGQVIFELVDGTRIAVDVGPDRQILSSISVVDRALATLQTNRNLLTVLVMAFLLLVVLLAERAILLTVRLLRRRQADGRRR